MNGLVRAQLKQLIQSPYWPGVEAFAAIMIDKWQNEQVKMPDEFNTVWRTAQREAKVEGLKEFFKTLEAEALTDTHA